MYTRIDEKILLEDVLKDLDVKYKQIDNADPLASEKRQHVKDQESAVYYAIDCIKTMESLHTILRPFAL